MVAIVRSPEGEIYLKPNKKTNLEFLVKASCHGKYCRGIILISNISFPECFIGKRFKLKAEIVK